MDGLLQLFALDPNHVVGETCHPKTAVESAFHWLEDVFGASVDEAEKAFHNGCGSTISLKVDQWFAVASAGDLGWFLRVIGEIVDIKR